MRSLEASPSSRRASTSGQISGTPTWTRISKSNHLNLTVENSSLFSGMLLTYPSYICRIICTTHVSRIHFRIHAAAEEDDSVYKKRKGSSDEVRVPKSLD